MIMENNITGNEPAFFGIEKEWYHGVE